MAHNQEPRCQSAILYQNAAQTITLIDIPSSISLAQQFPPEQPPTWLFSSPPLEVPYKSTEPKTEKAKANVLARMGSTNNSVYENLIRDGLREINNNHKTDWCLARKLSPTTVERQRLKRKFDDIVDASDSEPSTIEEPDIRVSLESLKRQDNLNKQYAPGGPIQLRPGSEKLLENAAHMSQRMIHNPYPYSLRLTLVRVPQTYWIPPKSNFFLDTINEQTAAEFFAAACLVSCTAAIDFDFILLDPPWENRSVRRSKKYSTLRDTDPLLALGNTMGQHIARDGLVACWITNKASVRESALGLFKKWNVTLTEEWVWVKTTLKGQPMCNVDGLWRKPYEVLLVGKKYAGLLQDKNQSSAKLQHKLIAAVPDLHSRKPCLKALIEPMMPRPDYCALEVFARHLTAGWFAWGDEVPKFNWKGHWTVDELVQYSTG